MGILARIENARVEERYARATPAERRTLAAVPWRPWDSYQFGYSRAFGIGGPRSPSQAYDSQEGSLGLTAVWGCIRHLCDSTASIPCRVYRRNPDGSSTRLPSSQLLGDETGNNGPQLTGTPFTWMWEATAGALLHGSAFGYVVERSGVTGSDGQGLPVKIAWLDPSLVYVQNSSQRSEDQRLAQVHYMGHPIPQADLVHLKAFSVPGHLEGLSPLRYHARTYAHGLAAQNFARTWFEAGGASVGSLQNINEEIDNQQAKEIRRMVTETLLSHETLVTGRDWKWEPYQVAADEAQFVTSRMLSSTDIASIYGVAPQRVGGHVGSSLTYTSQIMMAIDELQSSFRPWLVRWEHLLTSLLPANQYARFDGDAYLKTDPETRTTIQTARRNMGSRTVNELRAEDDFAPLDGGDDPINQAVAERMAGSTKALPKSMVPLVDFEADRIAAVVEGMTNAGVPGPPDVPVLKQTAEQYLAAKVTARDARIAELEQRIAELESGNG